MKAITIPRIIIAMALLALCARGEEGKSYKPEELVRVPTISLEEGDAIARNVGKVVRLRFCRKDEKSTANAAYLIVEVVVNGSYRTGGISVSVPSGGEKWVASLRTKTHAARADELVYARLLSKDSAQALGTKIVSGAKGKELAW